MTVSLPTLGLPAAGNFATACVRKPSTVKDASLEDARTSSKNKTKQGICQTKSRVALSRYTQYLSNSFFCFFFLRRRDPPRRDTFPEWTVVAPR